MIYEFEVDGPIKGKGRPRVNMATGSVYTPTDTKDYEMLVKQYFMIKYPRHEIITGRIKIEIKAFMEIPKSTSSKMKEKMLAGEISPTKKPDIDNITKIVLDALNKVVFKDDNQVTKIEVEKVYSEKAKVFIRIEEY